MQQSSSFVYFVVFGLAIVAGIVWQRGELPQIASFGGPSANADLAWPPRLGEALVDHNFVLRRDAGNPPRQDLYTELLPMVPELLREAESAK